MLYILLLKHKNGKSCYKTLGIVGDEVEPKGNLCHSPKYINLGILFNSWLGASGFQSAKK